jgi:2-haloacid dehalogenase
MEDVKVLAFDTGGTVLDWHAGLTASMAAWGAVHGIERDWHALANEHRRRSLRRMTNTIDPEFNIDDVHRDVLGELFDENGLGCSAEERRAIAERWHQLEAWPDIAAALRRLRRHCICVSFTILSLSLIVDVSRRNRIDWDAVISCEMLRVYKPLPDAYRRAAAFLAVEPHEILMVACHNFDLGAGRRLSHRLRPPTRRVGTRRPARSRTQPRHRHRGRRVCGTLAAGTVVLHATVRFDDVVELEDPSDLHVQRAGSDLLNQFVEVRQHEILGPAVVSRQAHRRRDDVHRAEIVERPPNRRATDGRRIPPLLKLTMPFRSLIGPRVSPVTAAEILLANSLRGSSQFQSRIKGKTNRRPQSSTMHRLMQSNDVVDGLLRFGTVLVVGIDIRGADDAPAIDHEPSWHRQGPAALTVANSQVSAKAEIDPLQIIGQREPETEFRGVGIAGVGQQVKADPLLFNEKPAGFRQLRRSSRHVP